MPGAGSGFACGGLRGSEVQGFRVQRFRVQRFKGCDRLIYKLLPFNMEVIIIIEM
jgi:hypothetical protein